MDRGEAYGEISRMFRQLARAEAASLKAAAGRHRLPAGSSRARVTTANARWAQAAEHRDRLADRIEERTGIRPAGAAARLQAAGARAAEAPAAPSLDGAALAPAAFAAFAAAGRAVVDMAAGLGRALAAALSDPNQREAVARLLVERARASARLRVEPADLSVLAAPAGDAADAGGAADVLAFARTLNAQLRAEEHAEGCPVRHGASVDCAWPGAVCLPVVAREGGGAAAAGGVDAE